MSRIRGKDTRPEMIVRRLLHRLGYRYRLHQKNLPGRPDIVFAARKKIVLVHGCFWHRHSCRFGQVRPETNSAFWKDKIGRNVARDQRNEEALRAVGWHVLTIWECEMKDLPALQLRLQAFVDEP